MEISNNKHGIITKGIGGLYGVRLVSEENVYIDIECRARGKFRFDGTSPLPGDDVIVLEETSGERTEYVIDEILPRSSALIRPPMANLTHLFVIVPSCSPKPDLLTVDKITAIAENSGVETVIIAGKRDMDPESTAEITDIYTKAGYNVFALSAVTGEGVGELKSYIDHIADEGAATGRLVRAAFVGVSGAGKSTLISALFDGLSLATNTVSRKTERGRHTTRQVEFFPLTSTAGSEFYLADTPGFSMLDFTRYNFFASGELAGNFREFEGLIGNCRYTKCTHTKEEGCAVLEQVQAGKIHPKRHDGYVQILSELKQKPEWKRQKEESTPPPRRRR